MLLLRGLTTSAFLIAAAAPLSAAAPSAAASGTEPLIADLPAPADPAAVEAGGHALYMRWCWGCHHQTQEAFGPALAVIARRRTPSQVRDQIRDPAQTAPKLGYARNAMPQLPLSDAEISLLTEYMRLLAAKQP